MGQGAIGAGSVAYAIVWAICEDRGAGAGTLYGLMQGSAQDDIALIFSLPVTPQPSVDKDTSGNWRRASQCLPAGQDRPRRRRWSYDT